MEMGPDLVGTTFLEGMAGRAFLGGGLAGGGIGTGKQGRHRHLGLFTATAALFTAGDDLDQVSRLFRCGRMIKYPRYHTRT